jgi:aminoglycoside phosphotransferase (APT) family kinase protein
MNILQKSDECIWFTGSSVVKMHMDQDFIAGRLARAAALESFVPEIKSHGKNTFTYSYVSGETLSRDLQKEHNSIKQFFSFLMQFWFEISTPALEPVERDLQRTRYLDFYRAKTLNRTRSLAQRFPKVTERTYINGLDTPALADQLESVDWELLATPLIGRVHGDLHPENVLVTGAGEYILLDWRQEIAGSHDAYGDVYYDLGKLAHGLRVDHGVVARGEFRVDHISHGEVTYSITGIQAKVNAYQDLKVFCEEQEFNWSRVLLVEALIYLNIAILHEPDEYTELLAFMGRHLLHSVSELAK